jgi:transposase
MRYLISDELWQAMEPLVAQAKRHRGGRAPLIPDRLFFEALLYWGRTGIPWRDLPAEFGAWDAVYNRFRRWVASGAMRRLFEAMTDAPQFEGVRRVSIDATIVRAHRHGAGAPRKKGTSAPRRRRVARASAAAGGA